MVGDENNTQEEVLFFFWSASRKAIMQTSTAGYSAM